ncbi:MAG: tetratricopeptide repeat protein [Acidobacteria bacterium]|nr:tetratricopeptide repeat protein [Acidobacteriota bacterium]
MRASRIIGFSAACALLLLALAFFGYRDAIMSRGESETQPAPQSAVAADQQATTPADLRIRAGEGQAKLKPHSPDGYNLLASAYMQKARETGDFGFNARAEASLKQSFGVEPDNYDAIKLNAKLLLTYHRFAEALTEAQRAQAQRPQDHDVYGALTDAHVELGQYAEAVESAQKMVDLRPDAPSYSRVSYLRALHGDGEGAVEAMRVAVQAADPRDPESLAWYRVHLGDELMSLSRRAEGEREYDNALRIFPDYHLALAAKARARVVAGDLETAVELYKKAQERVPLPDTAIALGDLYQKLGRADEARRQYDLVEFIEHTSAASGTYSRQLALFWADHDVKLGEALDIARRERESRADIYTEDALAWCLYKNGQLAEAKASMEKALRLGTRDPRLLYHAGMIYNALGERRDAAKYLKLALRINSSFDVLQAGVAQHTLDSLAA